MHAVRAGLCSMPPEELTSERIQTYLTHFPAWRQLKDKVWATVRSRLKNDVHPDVVSRVQRSGLWSGYHGRGQLRLTQFMGGGTWRDIDNIFRDFATDGPHVIPKDGFATSIVMSYQDAPDRISAFEFWGEHGRLLKFVHDKISKVAEGGLAMLETLQPLESTVYAIGDPEIALHLQRRWLLESDNPLKIVVFNDRTEAAWRCVNAERVILWTPDITWRLFKHARLVRNAFIACNPTSRTDSIVHHIISIGVPLALSLMERSAIPWPRFFAKWLCDRNTTDLVAKEAVAELRLTQQEKELILQECLPLEQPILENYFGNTTPAMILSHNNTQVSLRGSIMSVLRPRRGEEQFSDTAIRPDVEIADTLNGKIHWRGRILFRDREVPFTASKELIMEDTFKWLTGILARNALGSPTISPAWITQLVPLAQRFFRPRCISAVSKLGIYDDGTIVMPKFKLVDGTPKLEENWILGEDAPAVNVLPPMKRTPQPCDHYSPAKTAWVVCTASIVANWLSVLKGSQPTPVVVAGIAGSAGSVAAKHLARTAGMRTLKVTIKNKSSMDQLRKPIGEFNYPTFVETDSPGLLQAWPTYNNDFALLTATPEEAAALSVSTTWTIVHAPALHRGVSNLPPFDDVMFYLADLQSRHFELPDNPQTIYAVVDDICQWYERYVGIPQHDTLKEARRMLRINFYPGDALVDLCSWLHRMDVLPIEHTPLSSLDPVSLGTCKNKGIVSDDEKEHILVLRQALIRGVNKLKLPMPDINAATQDLALRKLLVEHVIADDGWIFTKAYWDTRVRNWRAANFTQ